MKQMSTSIAGYTKVIDGKITMVAQNVLDMIWPQVLPLLEESRSWWQDYYTLEDVLSECKTGSMQMWVGVENRKIFAIGLTCIVDYPQCRKLQCMFLAGKGAKTILPCIKEIEQWAALHGAIESEIIGRDAWIKLAAPFGYVKKSVVMVKRIASPAQKSNRSN